jgi:hypothetical protein
MIVVGNTKSDDQVVNCGVIALYLPEELTVRVVN